MIYIQNYDTWKIHLTIAINFIFSKDVEEERVMHSSSDNIRFTSYVNDLFESLWKSRNIIVFLETQGNLETSMGGSKLFFDSVQLMYYKFDKVNFRPDGSYIDSPGWIKNKKATIDPTNTDDKCFQYVVLIALSYKEIN